VVCLSDHKLKLRHYHQVKESKAPSSGAADTAMLLKLDPKAKPAPKASMVLSQVCTRDDKTCEQLGQAFDPSNCTCVDEDNYCTITVTGTASGSGSRSSSPAYGSVVYSGSTEGALTWGSYSADPFGHHYQLARGTSYTWGQYDIATAVKLVSQGGLGCAVYAHEGNVVTRSQLTVGGKWISKRHPPK